MLLELATSYLCAKDEAGKGLGTKGTFSKGMRPLGWESVSSRAGFAGRTEGRWIPMERNNTRTIRKLPCNCIDWLIGHAGSSLLHAHFSLVVVKWGPSLVEVLRPLTVMASRCRARVSGRPAPGAVACGFSSCGSGPQAPLVLQGLGCSAACGVFLDWGSNLSPLHC